MASCVASRVFKEGINWDAFKSMDDFENLNHVASPSAIFEGGKVERPKSLYVKTVADVINHFGRSLLHPHYGFGVESIVFYCYLVPILSKFWLVLYSGVLVFESYKNQ